MNAKKTGIIMPRMLIFLLSILLLSFQCALAQQKTGSLEGTISTSDSHGAAYVSVFLGKGLGTTTDENGHYRIEKITPGKYTVKVTAVGLSTQEKSVEVGTSGTTYLDFVLNEDLSTLTEVNISAGSKKYTADQPSPSLRLNQPLVTVPQNIQVITSSVLKDQQVFDMMESVSRNVSGVMRIGHWDMYANLQMRGSTVKPFRNGLNVYISPWSPLSEDMSMVDRIEFVKGPAGFMVSNGEPGGLYNVVTKKPTGSGNHEIGLVLGDYETYRTTADLDGKITKDGKWLYRLNVMGQLKNGHRDYEYNNRYSIAPVVKYLIDDQSSLTLEYNQQYAQMNVIGGNYAFSKRGYGDLPRNFTTAQPNFDPTAIRDQSLTAIFEHQLDDHWKLTVQGLYGHFKQQGASMWPSGFNPDDDRLLQRAMNNWDALAINKTAQVFLSGKVATGAVNHHILAGVDTKYSSYWADWNQWGLLGPELNIYNPDYSGVTLPVYDRSQNIRQRGVQYNYGYKTAYVQDELGFLDNSLRLTLAGRYTQNITDNPYEKSTRDRKFTPRAALSYSFDPSISAYFLYDQFFLQNPGVGADNKSFDPLHGDNIELGLKKDWFGGKWNSVISGYKITRNNILVATEIPNPAGGFFDRQGGQSVAKGIELDIRGEIASNLSIVMNYAYTDAEITKDSKSQFIGNRLPGTAKHLQNTWLSYRFSAKGIEGLKLSAGYQYMVDRVAGLVFDKQVYPLKDYFRLDAGAGYSLKKFDINLTVNNVLDKYLYNGGVSGGIYWWQTEPGRNFRLGINYKF